MTVIATVTVDPNNGVNQHESIQLATGVQYKLVADRRFIEALAAARLDGTYLRWINLIAKTPLLIVDDFGLQPLNHDMHLNFLQILEDRFG